MSVKIKPMKDREKDTNRTPLSLDEALKQKALREELEGTRRAQSQLRLQKKLSTLPPPPAEVERPETASEAYMQEAEGLIRSHIDQQTRTGVVNSADLDELTLQGQGYSAKLRLAIGFASMHDMQKAREYILACIDSQLPGDVKKMQEDLTPVRWGSDFETIVFQRLDLRSRKKQHSKTVETQLRLILALVAYYSGEKELADPKDVARVSKYLISKGLEDKPYLASGNNWSYRENKQRYESEGAEMVMQSIHTNTRLGDPDKVLSDIDIVVDIALDKYKQEQENIKSGHFPKAS